jgi:hypothetical protein
MIAFLLIGSGEVQPWAIKHAVEPNESEQTPLSGIISKLNLNIL